MNKIEVGNNQKEKTKVEVGQFYKYRGGNVYFVCRVGIGKFALINLVNGDSWVTVCDDINDIFDGDISDFSLITEEIKITPKS